MIKYPIFLISLSFLSFNSNALNLELPVITVDTNVHFKAELKTVVSDNGVTPFWIRNLQYGSIPLNTPGGIAFLNYHKNYTKNKKYDWKYSIEMAGWAGVNSDFMINEAYLSGRRGNWELWLGRRKEVYGLGDSTLTSGFYSWSGNARPMPKIQLGTKDYLNFFWKWAGIHMTYSHGYFDNSGPISGAMLHQKSLFGRLGKPNSHVSIFGGLTHQVSWGGEANVKNGGKFDFYPSSINTYYYVVTVSKNRTLVPIDDLSTDDDTNNQYGNHLGSIDFALKFQSKQIEMLVYKQTAFETGRVFSLTTSDDGLTGISIKRKKRGFIEKLVIENLYTQNLGLYIAPLAKLVGFKDPHYPEIENYFNNGGRGGWVYQSKGIGTPLIVLDSESAAGGSSSIFSLNAVRGYYLGLSGSFTPDFIWNLKVSKSHHGYLVGSLRDPANRYVVDKPQFASAFSMQKLINKKIELKAQIGYDQGEVINNTIGLLLGVQYTLF